MERALRLLAHIPAKIPVGPVVALVAVLGIWMMSAGPSAAQRVPDLERLEVNSAIANAARDGFFTKVVFVRRGGVAGTVIRQQPEPEVIRNKRSTIVLEVTKGVAQITVPDIRRLPVDEARHRIDDAHLTPGAVTYENHPGIEPNHVITSDPPSGSRVDVDTNVDIVAAA